MIYLWSGKTGSGKTSRMVKMAKEWYKKGIDIYSNISLDFTSVKSDKKSRIYFFNDVWDIFDVRDGLIIFDDAGAVFNAKSWEAMPIEFVYKLMLHRHHHLDMFASVPNIRSVHIDYRRLVQKWYYTKVHIRIGREKKPLFGFHSIVQKEIDQITICEDDVLADNAKNWYGKIKKPSYFLLSRLSRIFKFYDTHANINFKRLKTIWVHQKGIHQSWTIPKELSLSQGMRTFTLLRQTLNPKSRRNL